jgi:site-specific DNA recombinase
MNKPTTQPAAKRAAIYLRVATTRQSGPIAIQAQREACQQLARRLGMDIAHEYVDLGLSGRSIQRTGLQRLLTDLGGEHAVDYVLVERVSRLSRDHLIHERVLSALAKSGTRLLSAEETDGGIAQNESLSLLKLAMAVAYAQDRAQGVGHDE